MALPWCQSAARLPRTPVSRRADARKIISDALSSRCARAAISAIWSRVNSAGMPNASVGHSNCLGAGAHGSGPRAEGRRLRADEHSGSRGRRDLVHAGTRVALASTIDRYLAAAEAEAPDVDGDLVALIAPHAGLKYSGPVAAHAYRLLRGRTFDVAVLVGPSHFVGFDGVSLFPSGAFETPLGLTQIEAECGQAIAAASNIVHEDPLVHRREHSLEMQLPFLARLAPALPIVPLLIGHQTAATAARLGDALAAALRGRKALLIASTDLVALSRCADSRCPRPRRPRLRRALRCVGAAAGGARRDARSTRAAAGLSSPSCARPRALALAMRASSTTVTPVTYRVTSRRSSGYLAAALGRFDDRESGQR